MGKNHGQQVQQQQDPQGSNFTDRDMTCIEGANCLSGGSFVWTAGEQDFYTQKGFDTPPKRCKACRDRKKANQDQRSSR